MTTQSVLQIEQDKRPLATADALRRKLDQGDDHKAEFGQFLTPLPIAQFMASLFKTIHGDVRLLDPGAGVGALTAAFVEEACNRETPPTAIHAYAFELDSAVAGGLDQTLLGCAEHCSKHGINFSSTVLHCDFIEETASQLNSRLFGDAKPKFTHVIMNPPYKKIRSDSAARKLLRTAGVETSNLYTAFMSLASLQLEEQGQFVSITPRSFCNGPYFRSFRRAFLERMQLQRLHLFESRKSAFKDDSVLQENVIVSATKRARQDRSSILISCSHRACDDEVTSRIAAYESVVSESDPDRFIHLALDEPSENIAKRMAGLPAILGQTGASVSTGRVVDFRAKQYLRQLPDDGTLPLLYPCNISQSGVNWPRVDTKKSQAIVACKETEGLLVDNGYYVLVKRFTTKEEAKRIVACVLRPEDVVGSRIGIENHLNYFHCNGAPLEAHMAFGLAAFLNASLVDQYFRQFNGHTQVNATDLRKLRYPSVAQLKVLGSKMSRRKKCDQPVIDDVVGEVLGWN